MSQLKLEYFLLKIDAAFPQEGKQIMIYEEMFLKHILTEIRPRKSITVQIGQQQKYVTTGQRCKRAVLFHCVY